MTQKTWLTAMRICSMIMTRSSSIFPSKRNLMLVWKRYLKSLTKRSSMLLLKRYLMFLPK
jgi:hypothetical protein